MFTSAAGPPITYRDPWCSRLEDRLQALVARDRRIAYYYERPDAHTFRYRVFNMVQALDAQPGFGISSAWFTRDDLDRTLDFIDRADVLVICRTRYDHKIGQMIARARARGLSLLYDIDDLIFDLRHAHTIGEAINRPLQTSEDWDWWCAYIGRLGMTMQLCDGAITTNSFLGQHIAEFAPQLSVKVIANFLNRWQSAISHAIYRRKLVDPFQRDDKVHIGYFSGTNTHYRDFSLVTGALSRLVERNHSIILHVVGSLDLPERLAPYGDRIRRLPLQDFINLQRLQGEVEIAIAPVQDTVFTNCKSELKFFEAAIVGTVVVASPTVAFRHAIEDGAIGFLAQAHEWDGKLDEAVALLDGDAGAYRAVADRAYAHASRRYAWDQQAEVIATQIFGRPLPKPRPAGDDISVQPSAA